MVVLARNRYAVPEVDAAVAVAHALSGVLSRTSAALHHGWAVKWVPERPHVTVRRKRHLSVEQRATAFVHYADLVDGDVAGPATSKEVTLVDCLRSLPYDEALAVADSALRAGDEVALRRAARLARGPGSAQVHSVAERADGAAANPFESVLRAIAEEAGLSPVPQALITDVEPWMRPDLADRERRIVLEADSFQWHGDRAALRRDARRYDVLVAAGWIVLRFAWEDVMLDPAFVRQILVGVVARVDRQAEGPCARCGAA